MPDEICAPNTVADDCRQSAVQRLGHNESEAFLQRWKHEHTCGSEDVSQRCLGEGAVKVQWRRTSIRFQIVPRFAERRAAELHSPRGFSGNHQRFEECLDPFAESDVSREHNAELGGCGCGIRAKDLAISAVWNHPNPRAINANSDELFAHDR
jgi:hypothetical protein